MRYLLDACILSEEWKPAPHPALAAWLRSVAADECAISVVTLGELHFGAEILPPCRKRTNLERLIEVAAARFPVLPVCESAAYAWGRLRARGRALGRELPLADGLLLGTALARGLVLVTHDRDCEGRGVPTLDPWVV